MRELFDAIRSGEAQRVRDLLDRAPALVNASDEAGTSAFTFAKRHRQEAIAQLLLDRGAELDIFAAAIAGDAERTASLVAHNPALTQALSRDGWTALHLAAFFGSADCARRLIDAGADVHARSANPFKNTPLHAAAAGRRSEVARLLIERGAEVNSRQQGGWTALHAAAQNGDGELVRILIGAGADVNARADNGQRALDLALSHGRQQVVDLLEHFGAASA
ncbi:MAG TPA: ankyrin repeat domain-containing protein [Bryobacteraceae bacterium]|jgi:ankyrin repeat protein|nr:ankyrin repeat domain-containing protein [Bryobacteraceae bacterium]